MHSLFPLTTRRNNTIFNLLSKDIQDVENRSCTVTIIETTEIVWKMKIDLLELIFILRYACSQLESMSTIQNRLVEVW